MKFGVREIADVVLKAKAKQRVGNKDFYAGEPVIYFDTLKTSSMEGAATTVYAQGGRGNSRLVAWEGERTVTFTMEDALISPEGFMILSGAGLVQASASTPVIQHVTETVNYDNTHIPAEKKTDGSMTVYVSKMPYMPACDGENVEPGVSGNYAYVMLVKDGEIVSEPYVPVHISGTKSEDGKYYNYNVTDTIKIDDEIYYGITIQNHANYNNPTGDEYQVDSAWETVEFDSVIVDYYTRHMSGTNMQIDITPDKFGGNYYLEASTLFRTQDGVDLPAEFIIPNCKIQSNFTFTMASSGDPSTFTFTMDAFPDYTRFDKSKKVLAAIQVISATGEDEKYRPYTDDDMKKNEE